MPSLDSPPRAKSPERVANGYRTALKRFGPDGRIVRLDALDPVTRDIVVAILRLRQNTLAAKTAPAADAEKA